MRATGVHVSREGPLSTIPLLCRNEPPGLDADRLATLFVEVGEHRAQRIVDRALQDLGETLDLARGCHRAGRIEDLSALAARIEHIAEPLGLCSLARVAADLEELCDWQDEVALAAVLARLNRVADQSLRFAWSLGGMSG